MTEREAALEAELKASRLEVKLLREKVDALARMVFGKKSEKLDPNQLSLLQESEPKKDEAPAPNDDLEVGASNQLSTPGRKTRRKASRPRVPDHLPVKDVVIDPEEVKACPEQWRHIGEEVTEQLDYCPAQFRKLRQIRRKFVKLEEPFTPPVIAPLPPCLQERCLATADLIAQVIVSKYVDHLPLYRQEQIYRSRHGVEIPRQTQCRWLELAAWWFEPIYEEMIRQQNTRLYLQIDETPVPYLSPGMGKCPLGYFWIAGEPGGDVIYHWHPGRGAKYLDEIIEEDFCGTLQCDDIQGLQKLPENTRRTARTRRLLGACAPQVLRIPLPRLRRCWVDPTPGCTALSDRTSTARARCGSFVVRRRSSKRVCADYRTPAQSSVPTKATLPSEEWSWQSCQLRTKQLDRPKCVPPQRSHRDR